MFGGRNRPEVWAQGQPRGSTILAVKSRGIVSAHTLIGNYIIRARRRRETLPSLDPRLLSVRHFFELIACQIGIRIPN